jgi:tRNA-2-methylthio-N6-dimethylallyladenosine synthase
VLVEGPSKHAFSREASGSESSAIRQLTGRTMTDHIVVFDGADRLIGQTIPVQIHEATAYTLFGEVETSEQVSEPGVSAPGAASRGADAPRSGVHRRIGLTTI